MTLTQITEPSMIVGIGIWIIGFMAFMFLLWIGYTALKELKNNNHNG